MSRHTIRRVAFIGTGIMGAPIAGHILDAGYQLTVHNRTREKAEALLARGARWADSPAEAARDADVVFTMVGTPDDVEQVYLTSEGLLHDVRPGTWLIDLTTSSPQLARDIHDAAEVADAHAFDCPVTGGQKGAEDGTLTLIAGISEKDAVPVAPLLEAFSSKVYYFDQPGLGQLAKLCNQVSLAGCMVGMAEALALSDQGGLDTDLMLQMVSGGMGGSRAISDLAPLASKGDYRPGFRNAHFLKDIRLAMDAADDRGLTLPGAQTAEALYETLCSIGGSDLGTQAVELLYCDDATAAAAGLDWDLLDEPAEGDGHDEHDGCCHGHGDDGECCHGNGHGEDGECHCGHHHDHEGR